MLYLRDRRTAGYKTPTVFRFIVLILLVLITAGNIFRFSYNQSPKTPVVVLVDASKSINAGENISSIKQIIDKIQEQPYRKLFFSFTDSIGPIENYQKADGKRTDIAQALNFAQKNRPGAIVLISDGQHNVRSDPTVNAKSIQAPIYTVGIGSEEKQDLIIQSIRKPIKSFLGDTVEITSRIQNKGFENRQTKVNLQHKGKNIASKDVLFSGKDVIQEVNFKVIPETTGKVSYTALIDNLPDEADYMNNRKDFSVEVLKNRWQIVYLTNSPSFNTRFIISNLENTNGAESNFSVIPMIAFAGRDLEILKEITMDKAFQNADVVILDDINESDLNAGMIVKLRNLIDQNKGFLVLAGENFKPGALLKEIMPFEFTTNNIQRKDIFIELTDVGTGIPIFFTGNGEYLLDNTPPLWGANVAQNTKSDAVVWLTSKEKSIPLMGYRFYKNSKIVLMTGFPFWRLGFSAIETERTKQRFDQFLKNLMRFLAIKESDAFKLETDKPNYLNGENIIFNLLATTPDGRSWTDLDISVEIPQIKVSLPLYEISAGIYEGETEALIPGTYQVEASVTKDGKLIGKANITYSVTQQSIEDITGLDSDLLMKLSNSTGGRYYSISEFLNESFAPNIIKYKRTLSFTFHNNRYIYIIITALFGILLFLRKKRGFL